MAKKRQEYPPGFLARKKRSRINKGVVFDSEIPSGVIVAKGRKKRLKLGRDQYFQLFIF